MYDAIFIISLGTILLFGLLHLYCRHLKAVIRNDQSINDEWDV